MFRLTKHGETKHVSRGSGGGEQIATYHEGSAYNAVVFTRSAWYFTRRNYVYWAAAGELIAAIIILGAALAGVLYSVVVLALVGYRLRWAEHFERNIAAPTRGRLRLTFVYFRPWQSTCESIGLADKFGNVMCIPALRKVESGRYIDRLVIKPINGQDIDEYREATGAFETTYRRRRVKVRHGTKGRIWLDMERRYALDTPLLFPPISETVADYTALPVGLTEFGTPWTQRVLGSHLFIAGMTGAGKSSFVWSIVGAMLPGIRDAEVKLWGIDPKGGIELNKGRALFAPGCLETGRDLHKQIAVIERFVAAMGDRAEQMGKLGMRKLEKPTKQMPLNVLIIDEGAWVVSYVGDAKTKRGAEDLLRMALSQGRALGFVIIFAVQDPRVEVCKFRSMFVDSIGLRMQNAGQVKMVLGDGAVALGARCHEITHDGVGYVFLEGEIEPFEVRAFWVKDPDLAYWCEHYAAPGPAVERSNVVFIGAVNSPPSSGPAPTPAPDVLPASPVPSVAATAAGSDSPNRRRRAVGQGVRNGQSRVAVAPAAGWWDADASSADVSERA